MAQVLIRNLPDEVHRALRAQAKRSGRSTEAEIRQILADAVQPQDRPRLGSLLREIGREARLSDDEVAVFDDVRGSTPLEPMEFR